ncbi:hypothetical protein ACJIZ3_000022 [Penstemon smallii]|uniref:Uncharacterized protein n=1 Tax=Penstemon smallii TaxID=265156 RepID=A0ABD3RC64_9LAMI
MGAIIPALMHRIPSELRTSILEFIEASDSGIYWPSSCCTPLLIDFYLNFHLVWRKPRFWKFIGPFRLRSYHLNN